MKREIVAALAVIALGALPTAAPAAQHAGAKRAGTTQSAKASGSAFMKQAAQGGMAEVELGKLASERAENPDVKQFAQRMVDDHTKANDELKQVAEKKGVTLPSDTDAKHRAEMDHLAKLSGAEFDRAYMHHMVGDHDHDVAAFQQESRKAKDPDLKAWIDKTLPTLKEHQQQAQQAASKVGVATMHGKTGGQTSGTMAAHPARRTHQGRASR
jgi:putative membrane protein